MPARPLRIDLWSDLVCPWCYIGKRRLERAVEASGRAGEVEIVLRSFELDPREPREPRRVLDMLAAKYGGTSDQVAAMEERVAGLARDEGLPYTTERIHANTFDVHRVTQLAAAHGAGAQVFDALQTGLFGGTADPWEPATLRAVAADSGIDPAEVDAVLASDRYAGAVRADEALAARIGITGVPFTAFDMAVGVPGAQSVEVFGQALAQAFERREAAPTP